MKITLSPHPAFARSATGILLTALLIGFVALSSTLRAATYTWDSTGGGAAPVDGPGTWDTGANWWNGTSDISWTNLTTDTAVFGAANGTAGAITVGNVTANGIRFNAATSGTYTLSGGSITLGGATPTITANVAATIGSTLLGTSGLTKAGVGTLSLTGSLGYTGPTAVSTGTLNFAEASGTNLLNGAVTGGGAITKSGSGTVIIVSTTTNTNTFSGSVVVNGGTLQSGSDGLNNNMGLYNASSYTVNAGATLATARNALNSNAPMIVNGGTLMLLTTLSGGGGGGAQALGALTLNGGTLISGPGITPTINGFYFTGDLTVGGAATSFITTAGGANSGINLITSGSVRTFNVADVTGDANADLVVSAPLLNTAGNLSAAATLIKAGAGTMVLSGTNLYTGGTIINAGTLQLGNANSITATTGSLTVNSTFDMYGYGATVSALSGSATGLITNSAAGSSILTAGGSTDATYNGVIKDGLGMVGLTKAGASTLSLTGSLGYTGPTVINTGTLNFAEASGTNILNGAVTGGGAIAKSGAGTVLLVGGTAGGINTFSGSVVVNGGTLQLGNDGLHNSTGLPSASSYTVNSGATLATARDAMKDTSPVVLNGGTLLIEPGLVGGATQGFASLTLNGGTLISAPGITSAYDGVLLEGDVTVGGTAASLISTAGGANSGVNLTTSGSMRTFNVADATGNANADLIVSAPLINQAGNLSIAAGLIKAGVGTMVISSTSTYTGATNILAGTLVISGSLSGSSAVTVGDSSNLGTAAILGGSGFVGNVTVGAAPGDTGATLAPHAGSASTSVGNTLTTGTLAFTDGSAHLALEIGRTNAGTSGAGDVSDHLHATGVTLNGADLDLSLLATSHTIAQGDILFLIINTGGAVGGTFGSLNGVPTTLSQGSIFTFNSQPYEITYLASDAGNSFTGGNDVALLAVPEPGATAMLFSGFSALLGFKRMRKNRVGTR